MSAEIDAWRLADALSSVEAFNEKFYSEDYTDDEVSNWAIFTLGRLTATLYMSDEVVMRRIAETNQG